MIKERKRVIKWLQVTFLSTVPQEQKEQEKSYVGIYKVNGCEATNLAFLRKLNSHMAIRIGFRNIKRFLYNIKTSNYILFETQVTFSHILISYEKPREQIIFDMKCIIFDLRTFILRFPRRRKSKCKHNTVYYI